MLDYLTFFNAVSCGVFRPARYRLDSALVYDCFLRGYSIDQAAQIVERDAFDVMSERC